MQSMDKLGNKRGLVTREVTVSLLLERDVRENEVLGSFAEVTVSQIGLVFPRWNEQWGIPKGEPFKRDAFYTLEVGILEE